MSKKGAKTAIIEALTPTQIGDALVEIAKGNCWFRSPACHGTCSQCKKLTAEWNAQPAVDILERINEGLMVIEQRYRILDRQLSEVYAASGGYVE